MNISYIKNEIYTHHNINYNIEVRQTCGFLLYNVFWYNFRMKILFPWLQQYDRDYGRIIRAMPKICVDN